MNATTTSVAMHWIDGKWVDSDEHRDSVNPATGEVVGSYAMGGFAVMDDFIEFKHIRLRPGTTPAV
jgi:acyl-CoA reductase-like NAD-dependent aldehyde dehydrogenase